MRFDDSLRPVADAVQFVHVHSRVPPPRCSFFTSCARSPAPHLDAFAGGLLADLYGWWNPVYLLLLVPLTLANFAIATRDCACRDSRMTLARALMIIGVHGKSRGLAPTSSMQFLRRQRFNSLLGLEWVVAAVVLPLGISFFTFQKIAYVVDSYRGKIDRYDLLEFALFVTFFPPADRRTDRSPQRSPASIQAALRRVESSLPLRPSPSS